MERVRVRDGLALALGLADRCTRALREADGLTLGVLSVSDGLGETLGDTVGETLDEAELATPGDSFGNAECGDDEQETTAADASTAAKPAAVSRTPSPGPAAVARIFMSLRECADY